MKNIAFLDLCKIIGSPPHRPWQGWLLAFFWFLYGLSWIYLYFEHENLYYIPQISLRTPDVHWIFLLVGILFFAASVVLIGSSCLREYTVKYLAHFNWPIWLSWGVGCYFIGSFDSYGYLRIYIFKSIAITALIIWLPLAVNCWRTSIYNVRVALIFILIFCVSWSIQGSYFPPFFEGIGGWTRQFPDNNTLNVSSYKIVREDGDKKWITYNLFSPSPYLYNYAIYARYKAHMRSYAIAENSNDVLQSRLKYDKDIKQRIRKKQFQYIYQLYRYHWPRLQHGIFPNNRYLGDLAMPSHGMHVNPDYSSFPPDRIEQIQYVHVRYDAKTGNKIHEKVIDSYDVQKTQEKYSYGNR